MFPVKITSQAPVINSEAFTSGFSLVFKTIFDANFSSVKKYMKAKTLKHVGILHCVLKMF